MNKSPSKKIYDLDKEFKEAVGRATVKLFNEAFINKNNKMKSKTTKKKVSKFDSQLFDCRYKDKGGLKKLNEFLTRKKDNVVDQDIADHFGMTRQRVGKMIESIEHYK